MMQGRTYENEGDSALNWAYRGIFGLNVAVFTAWRISLLRIKRRNDPLLFNWMSKHFTCSKVNLLGYGNTGTAVERFFLNKSGRKHRTVGKEVIAVHDAGGRWYTALASGFSHMSWPHFLINMWLLDTVVRRGLFTHTNKYGSQCSHMFDTTYSTRRMSSSVPFQVEVTSNDSNETTIIPVRIHNTNSSVETVANTRSTMKQKGNVFGAFDLLAVYSLASIAGAFAEVLLNRTKLMILGASSGIVALLSCLGQLDPDLTFQLIFPVPFLTVNALQIVQWTLAFEGALALKSIIASRITEDPANEMRKKGGKCSIPKSQNTVSQGNRNWMQFRRFFFQRSRIAWIGHVGGLITGIVYSWYKRNIHSDERWRGFWELSYERGWKYWRLVWRDIKVNFLILRINLLLAKSRSDIESAVLRQEIEQLRSLKDIR